MTVQGKLPSSATVTRVFPPIGTGCVTTIEGKWKTVAEDRVKLLQAFDAQKGIEKAGRSAGVRCAAVAPAISLRAPAIPRP